MDNDRCRELLGQLEWYWDAMLWPRLQGLTDNEYLWEPARHCWTVRSVSSGRFLPDWEHPEPSPPPFTTIAWRMCHIGDVFAERAEYHFGDRSYPPREEIDWPGTADDALAFIDIGYRRWFAGVSSLDDAALLEHREGPPETLDAEFPFSAVILHVNREVIHHGAEVAVLRDLFRAREATPESGDGSR